MMKEHPYHKSSLLSNTLSSLNSKFSQKQKVEWFEDLLVTLKGTDMIRGLMLHRSLLSRSKKDNQ